MSWGPLSVFTATHDWLAPATFFCLRYKLLLTYLRYSGPLYLNSGADLSCSAVVLIVACHFLSESL